MKLVLRNPISAIQKATCIFFHGSGDTGENLIEGVRSLLGRDFEFPHVKVIYPTAPFQPYTPLDGEYSNVWFDRGSVTIEALENRKSMNQIYETVHELINSEVEQGMPLQRIIVGGFSMGGALAMHAGFHLNKQLAGVFACSSFLNRDSVVYESLQNHTTSGQVLPELRMYHGDEDTVVPPEWGKETFNKLKQLGVAGEFSTLNNLEHEMNRQELSDIQDWILKKLQ